MTYYGEVNRQPIHAGYVFDLDGTVYVDDHLVPGAAETIAELRARGARITFLTNKPLELPADYAAKLSRLGIPTRPEDVVSSTDALLLYLRDHAAGARIHVLGEPTLVDLVRDAGFALSDEPGDIDVVVVSFDRTFDYRKLLLAFRAVRAGARIVATNPDPFCPTADGGLPDCGALLAALETATGRRAEAIVGKPSSHMARAVLERLGVTPDQAALVGDRLLTDVRMAHEVGMTAILVLTGATSRDDLAAADPQPDLVLPDITGLLGSTEPAPPGS
jgi:NagD protein